MPGLQPAPPSVQPRRPRGRQARPADRFRPAHPGDWLLCSRSRPFFDPVREQACYLSDARRTHVWPAGLRIDIAQVGLAVELRQRVEEGRSAMPGDTRPITYQLTAHQPESNK